MQRSLFKILFYNALHVTSRLASVLYFRMRVFGRENMPRIGPVIICGNHQSNLDPVLMGLALDRRLNYLARDNLFGFAPFRWLCLTLDAIPIDRDGFGLAGFKECLRRLKAGEMINVFPEGTRTHDGGIGPFKAGFTVLAKRTGAYILPVGLAGAYEAYPRGRLFPMPVPMQIVIGKPIGPELSKTLEEPELLAELRRRIVACQQQAQEGIYRHGALRNNATRDRRKTAANSSPAATE